MSCWKPTGGFLQRAAFLLSSTLTLRPLPPPVARPQTKTSDVTFLSFAFHDLCLSDPSMPRKIVLQQKTYLFQTPLMAGFDVQLCSTLLARPHARSTCSMGSDHLEGSRQIPGNTPKQPTLGGPGPVPVSFLFWTP